MRKCKSNNLIVYCLSLSKSFMCSTFKQLLSAKMSSTVMLKFQKKKKKSNGEKATRVKQSSERDHW